MATLDEIRLQQLLSPFTNTGITSINQKYMDPKYTYDGLYQDPDRFLDYDNSRNDNSPMGNDYPFTGNIPTNRLARIDAIHYNRENLSSLPNNPYGVRSDYFDNFSPRIGLPSQIPQNLAFLPNQVPQINNEIPQINNQILPQNFEFLQSAYEDQDEDAAQVDSLPGQKKKLSDMGRNFGISSLIGMITGNPIIGLLSKGIKGLAGLNNRMQNSDFGRSRTGADFFKARRDREALARDPNVFKDARDITSRIQRDAGRNDRPDRNISSVTRSSAAKSKGVGGGGYTKSDSNRESYRG